MTKDAQDAAQQVMDVVPVVMRTMRAKLRERRAADISVPQFRTMAYINRNNGASLSDLSAHIGLTLPSMSKLVDGLVSRNLISRIGDSQDRRKICLSLTPQGRDELKAAYGHTQKYIAGKNVAPGRGGYTGDFESNAGLEEIIYPRTRRT